MKRRILLLSLVMFFLSISAQTLILHHANGTTTDISLGNMPNIKFNGDRIVITTSTSNFEYSKDEILGFTYRYSRNDVNGDYQIDVADIASVISIMANPSGDTANEGDVNGDGAVDVADIASLISVMANGEAPNLPATMSLGGGSIGETFFCYRNDGNFNGFFREDVDSIAYSHYDSEGRRFNKAAFQLVYTPDSIYRIPIAVIDSVGFVKPQTIFKSNVIQMESGMSDYLLEQRGLVLLLRNSIPNNIRPKKDDVIIYTHFDNPILEDGFAGKVLNTYDLTDTLFVECEPITKLSDVFEQYVDVTKLSLDNATSRTIVTKAPKGSDWVDFDVNLGLIRDNDGGTGSFTGNINGAYHIDHQTEILDGREIENFTITIEYRLGLGLEIDYKLINENSSIKKQLIERINRKLKDAAHFTTPALRFPQIPIMKLDATIYALIISEFDADIALTSKFTSRTFTRKFNFSRADGSVWRWNRTTGGNDAGDSPKLENSLSLKGSAAIGPMISFRIATIGSMNYIQAALDIKPALKLSGEFMITQNSMPTETWYQTYKDNYISPSFDLKAELYGGAYFLGEEKWKFKVFDATLFSWPFGTLYAYPNFTTPTVSIKEDASINVTSHPSRNILPLPPYTLGIGLYDSDNHLVERKTSNSIYITESPTILIDQDFTSLKRNTEYTVRPIIQSLGLFTIPADPTSTFKLDPLLETRGTGAIGVNNAIVQGFVDGIESQTDYILGFRYNKAGEPDATNSNLATSSQKKDGLYEVNIIDLEPNTKYYYRAYLDLDGKQYYGKVSNFTTNRLNAIPTTGEHYNESVTGATIECTYSNVTVGMECGYTLNGHNYALGTVYGKRTIHLTGLEPATEYEYNSYIIQNGIRTEGIPNKFTTLTPLPTTLRHYEETLTGATIVLKYENVPDGAECGYFLDKEAEGTSASISQNVALGTIKGEKAVKLTNLEPDTRYFYQAYIKYNGKTYWNPDVNDEKEFRTLAPIATTGDLVTSTTTTAIIKATFENVPENAECGVSYYCNDETFLLEDKRLGRVEGEKEIILEDLLPGKEYHYVAYIKYKDKPYEGLEKTFKTKSVPVEITNFTVTKAEWKRNGYEYNGKKYVFKYNCSVTVKLTDATNVEDWGYCYVDPDGKPALISLKGKGTSYTDKDYAYCRNEPEASVILYGYVWYRGEETPQYAEGWEYPLVYDAEPSISFQNAEILGTISEPRYDSDGKYLFTWYTTQFKYVIKIEGGYWIDNMQPTIYDNGSWLYNGNKVRVPGDGLYAITTSMSYDNTSNMNWATGYSINLTDGNEINSNNYLQFGGTPEVPTISVSGTYSSRIEERIVTDFDNSKLPQIIDISIIELFNQQ